MSILRSIFLLVLLGTASTALALRIQDELQRPPETPESLAPDGATLIAQMVSQAAGRISVMPGCGLTADNVVDVMAITGVQEVHAACSVRVPGDLAFSDFDPPGGRFETSETQVREMVNRIGS